MRVILASNSPRRREILSGLGLAFEVKGAHTDERSDIDDPVSLVKELALRKGLCAREELASKGEWNESTVLIAADTVVAVGNEILGKPRDAADADRMLALLSDTRHRVVSGVALFCGDRIGTDADTTLVSFGPMPKEAREWYIRSKEPFDKAGAYAIQGLASLFIKGIEGDYFNVVGLPVYVLNRLSKRMLSRSLTELSK